MDPNPRVGEEKKHNSREGERNGGPAKVQLKRRGKPGEENQQKFLLVQRCLFKRMHTNDGRTKVNKSGLCFKVWHSNSWKNMFWSKIILDKWLVWKHLWWSCTRILGWKGILLVCAGVTYTTRKKNREHGKLKPVFVFGVSILNTNFPATFPPDFIVVSPFTACSLSDTSKDQRPKHTSD